jgi:SAM-dependent methyltransferase
LALNLGKFEYNQNQLPKKRGRLDTMRGCSMDEHKLFAENSENYAQARPQYPKALFEYLNAVCNEHDEAWDGACGNGQAAVGLVDYFKKVQATDINEGQIVHAIQHPKVNYSVQAAEETNFDKNQFDLVCIAQALHWFDQDLFWPEVERVLKPKGIFAAWGYSWFSIEDGIDACISEKLLKVLEPYWAEQNKTLWHGYRDVHFPFNQMETPAIEMNLRWDIDQLFAYLQSWSATRRCMSDQGNKFLVKAYESVKSEWGDADKKKKVSMDFNLYIGRSDAMP